MVQLNQGARPLIDTHMKDKMAIVLQEILQDKIYLDKSQEVGLGQSPDFTDTPELNLDDLVILQASVITIQRRQSILVSQGGAPSGSSPC